MFEHNSLILEINLNKNEEKTIDLKQMLPLGKLECESNLLVEKSYDGLNFTKVDIKDDFLDQTVRFLKLTSESNTNVKIYAGLGYIISHDDKMTDLFTNCNGWGGADGIYSFNLEKEKETYDQKDDTTLFVFGDTFAGATEGLRRLEPTAMVNNTLAYYKQGEIDFVVNRGDTENYISLFEPNEAIRQRGYIASNLVRYSSNIVYHPYISALNPQEDVEVTFDLHGKNIVNKIEIENYHEEPDFGLDQAKRGAKRIDIYVSDNDEDFYFYKQIELDKYSLNNPIYIIDVNIFSRYIRFVFPLGEDFNQGGLNKLDKVVGLKKVFFFNEKEQLFDISVSANSEANYKLANAWYWLQDGIRHLDDFYIFPTVVEEDLNGLAGFEFKISGTCMIKCKIKNQKIDFNNAFMREVPLFNLSDNKEYILPAAIFNNNGEDEKADGYVYFYGYYNDCPKFMRSLIVGRIKPENLDNLNELRYFDGESWVKDMTKAAPLLDHISCEMSVQLISEGENAGKYLAVFQYDVNGPYLAYAIGESLTGPFSEPRIIYRAKEVDEMYKGTTYAYNAKSHLHLSSPKDILVSYNVNDTSMENNKKDYTIYHPRFLNFHDNSND
jgi:hypothetical protein